MSSEMNGSPTKGFILHIHLVVFFCFQYASRVEVKTCKKNVPDSDAFLQTALCGEVNQNVLLSFLFIVGVVAK